MSDNKKNETPQTEPVEASQAKSFARIAKARKVATVCVLSATALAGVVLLMALAPKAYNGIVITREGIGQQGSGESGVIDPTKGAFTMTEETATGDVARSYLRGEALSGNVMQTRAQTVRAYYDSLLEEKDLDHNGGSHNFVDKDGEAKATVYTFFLRNDSATIEAKYRLQATLTNRTDPTNNARNPYDYLRIILLEGNVGEADDSIVYYGNANVNETGTVDGGVSDSRECISTWERENHDADSEHPYYLRKPLYSDGENSYCVNFENKNDPDLLFDAADHRIAPGKIRRITFIAYFEGEDPDALGTPPKGSSFGFGITVGS